MFSQKTSLFSNFFGRIDIEPGKDIYAKMEHCSYYDPNGRSVDKEAFVAYYNEKYYLNSDCATRVSKNSKWIEGEIDCLLKRGIKSEEDIIHILAWKIGKLKHKDCEEKKDFIYATDWKGAKEYRILRYGKPFEIKDFVRFVVSNIDRALWVYGHYFRVEK